MIKWACNAEDCTVEFLIPEDVDPTDDVFNKMDIHEDATGHAIVEVK